MTPSQTEALVLCLLGSLIWAPIVYAAAHALDRRMNASAGERIWTAALAAAVLPSLIAPAIAATGFSLRPAAPAPLEFYTYAAPIAQTALTPALIEPASAPGASFSPSMLLDMTGLIYLYGAALAVALWLMRHAGVALKIHSARTVRDETLMRALEQWREKLGVKAPLVVRQSRHVSSVCVFGVVRPVILIPNDIRRRVSSDDLILMCAHELAHIKRGDCGLFALNAALRAAFWFNPFVKMTASRLEIAAEQGADRLVVTRGANRRAYAACFVEALRYAAARPQQRALSAMPTFTPLDRQGRRRRLEAILASNRPSTISWRMKCALAAIAALGGLGAFTQAAIAVAPSTDDHQPGEISKMPLKGEIGLTFSGYHKKLKANGDPSHPGVDILAKRGADIRAAGAGVVIKTMDDGGKSWGWGKMIVIDHGQGLITRYGHLDSIGVRLGQKVYTGEIIGKVGATGSANRPQLHFEARQDGKAVDPLELLGVTVKRKAELPPSAPTNLISPITASLSAPAALTAKAPSSSPAAPNAAPAPATKPAPQPAPYPANKTIAKLHKADLKKRTAAAELEFILQEDVQKAPVVVKIRKKELTAAEQRKIEQAIGDMRGRMQERAAARSALEANASHEAAASGAHEIVNQLTQHALSAAHRSLSENEAAQQFLNAEAIELLVEKSTADALRMQDQALATAQKSLRETRRGLNREMNAAEAELKREVEELSRAAIRLARNDISKKELELVKKEIEQLKSELRNAARERRSALREAKRTVEEHEREIEELRAALAAARG